MRDGRGRREPDRRLTGPATATGARTLSGCGPLSLRLAEAGEVQCRLHPVHRQWCDPLNSGSPRPEAAGPKRLNRRFMVEWRGPAGSGSGAGDPMPRRAVAA
jgi:hypothetical protein